MSDHPALPAINTTNDSSPLNNPAHNETAHNETAHNETANDETTNDETANDETANNETANNETAPRTATLMSAEPLTELLSDTDFVALTDPSLLAQPSPLPIKQANYKSCPEHFIVNEQLDIDFTGEGEHLWLLIKKRGVNTAHVATLLADWAGIPARDVGYSGLKDRHAVTTQWFSLRIPNRTLPEAPFAPLKELDTNKHHEQIELVCQHWHNKKLNRGTHKSNEFIITLTDVQYDNVEAVNSRLQQISADGVPNYFGGQRFGHYGNNIKEALRELGDAQAKDISSHNLEQHSAHKGKKNHRINKRQREQQSMLLSAARSLIFNKILDRRVANGTWDSGVSGEVFNLDGTGSIFSIDELDDELIARVRAKDIHPTAVLWGTGNEQVSGDARLLELQTVHSDELLKRLAEGLEARGIKAQRRALRLMVQDLTWRWLDDTQNLELQFSLTTGSYATSVLSSLVSQLQAGLN